jgi:hypothetical protein
MTGHPLKSDVRAKATAGAPGALDLDAEAFPAVYATAANLEKPTR